MRESGEINMKPLKVMHQGDVLFIKVAEMPNLNTAKKLTATKGKGIIIQHGEALGHYHRVEQENTMTAYEIGEKDSVKEMALLVEQPTQVVHEEHRALTLEPGFWIARTQRENFQGTVRAVLD